MNVQSAQNSKVDPFGELPNLGESAEKLTADKLMELLSVIVEVSAQQIEDCTGTVEEAESRISVCKRRHRELQSLKAELNLKYGSTSDGQNFSSLLSEGYKDDIRKAQAAFKRWQQKAEAYVRNLRKAQARGSKAGSEGKRSHRERNRNDLNGDPNAAAAKKRKQVSQKEVDAAQSADVEPALDDIHDNLNPLTNDQIAALIEFTYGRSDD